MRSLIVLVLTGMSAIAFVGSRAATYSVDAEPLWTFPLEHAGKSSVRTADLSGDGVPDVIVGAGIEDRWGEVVALDGKTGGVQWRRRLPDEVLLTLPLLDVNDDGVPDVFVAGRTRLRDVYVLSGKDGEPVWRLTRSNPDTEFLPINFINLLLVDDLDGDGLADLLAVQSGGKDSRRLAARFYWVRSRDGSLLKTDIAPDGRESYAMPLYEARSASPERFYIGTGGETLAGNLIKVGLPSFEPQWRIRSIGGGFIGSPLLVDLDGDGRDELVAAGMNGGAYVLDADSGEIRWEWRERPHWTYVSPAAGSFNEDTTLDVVAAFNQGVFPRRERSKLLWLDGASGRVISEKSIEGRFRYTASSPLVLDVDHDGLDETLIVLSSPVPDHSIPNQTHRLLLFDGGVARDEVLDLELDGYSIATPWLGDLDGNGKLDMLHASQVGVTRYELAVKGGSGEKLPRVRWGELRGPNGSGILSPKP